MTFQFHLFNISWTSTSLHPHSNHLSTSLLINHSTICSHLFSYFLKFYQVSFQLKTLPGLPLTSGESLNTCHKALPCLQTCPLLCLMFGSQTRMNLCSLSSSCFGYFSNVDRRQRRSTGVGKERERNSLEPGSGHPRPLASMEVAPLYGIFSTYRALPSDSEVGRKHLSEQDWKLKALSV